MRINSIKISLFIFLLLCLSSCGFKPMYKLSENDAVFKSYSISIINEANISREIKEEIRKSFPSDNIMSNYHIEIEATQTLDPLITNTDGTISKYRVEIILDFKVKDNDRNIYLMENKARGFAQYTVETSEIESNDKKKRMIQTATRDAVQMMSSKIQSDTSIANDN
jgi:hypothetical protein